MTPHVAPETGQAPVLSLADMDPRAAARLAAELVAARREEWESDGAGAVQPWQLGEEGGSGKGWRSRVGKVIGKAEDFTDAVRGIVRKRRLDQKEELAARKAEIEWLAAQLEQSVSETERFRAEAARNLAVAQGLQQELDRVMPKTPIGEEELARLRHTTSIKVREGVSWAYRQMTEKKFEVMVLERRIYDLERSLWEGRQESGRIMAQYQVSKPRPAACYSPRVTSLSSPQAHSPLRYPSPLTALRPLVPAGPTRRQRSGGGEAGRDSGQARRGNGHEAQARRQAG